MYWIFSSQPTANIILLFPKPSPLRRWLFPSFLPRWLQIFLLWPPCLTLNFFPLVNTCQHQQLTHHHSLCSKPRLHTRWPHTKSSFLSPNVAITIFVIFAVCVQTSTPKHLPSSPLPLFTPSSTTATLSATLSLSAQVSDHPAPTDSGLLQIQSHNSHPPVSALVKDN